MSHIYGIGAAEQPFVEAAAAIAKNVAGPAAADVDARARFPREAVGAIQKQGLAGLTILAAGGSDPRGVRKGHEALRELLETMHENRIKRLEHAGFSAAQAKTLSDLHTPNFM